MEMFSERENSIRLKLGPDLITASYRRPGVERVIETLVKKMPRGDEAKDAERVLLANLELGRECVTGINMDIRGPGSQPGELRRPENPDLQGEWLTKITRDFPLVLIALGQYLSQPPAFVEESEQKKTCAPPRPFSGENLDHARLARND